MHKPRNSLGSPAQQLAIAVMSRCAVAFLLLYSTTDAMADPGYYVVTVYDDPGIKTIDFRYWTVAHRGSPTVTWPEVGLGWNITRAWYSEVFASYIGSSSSATKLSTLNWQNDILLTHGQYPFDLAIHTQLVETQNTDSGRTIEIGPVVQTEIGRTQINANLFFERGFGSEATSPTQLKYQWQLRHHWQPNLHFGAQGFGELGPWEHWAPQKAQSHRLGPALFGQLPMASGTLAWQAAYLIGSTYSRNGSMLTMRVKYLFE